MARGLAQSFQAARPENWWFSKLPPLLAVAYLGLLGGGGDSSRAGVLLGSYLFSICMLAAYGHVINDACDVEADLGAGKINAMADVSRPWRVCLCAALMAAGFAPTSLAPYSASTLVLLGLNFVWPTVYSVPGPRLKERGIAGLACDALGSHVTPTLIALSIFGTGSGPQSSRFFPAAAVAWAAALGIKGILHHQILDRANDLRSGTATFATKVRPERMSRFLTLFNLCVELPLSAWVVAVTGGWAPFVAASFAVYCALETAKYGLGFQFALTSEAWTVRRSVPFTNESFYVVWLPLAAVVQLAVVEPAWRWAPIAHVVLFYRNFSAQIQEIRAVFRIADLPNRVARWRR
jgi:4-hydroxybenzoate polyprenyltransferase